MPDSLDFFWLFIHPCSRKRWKAALHLIRRHLGPFLQVSPSAESAFSVRPECVTRRNHFSLSLMKSATWEQEHEQSCQTSQRLLLPPFLSPGFCSAHSWPWVCWSQTRQCLHSLHPASPPQGLCWGQESSAVLLPWFAGCRMGCSQFLSQGLEPCWIFLPPVEMSRESCWQLKEP